MRKRKYIIIGFIFVFAVITCIHPLFPKDQLLQHIGTFFLLLLLLKNTFDKQEFTGFLGIALFTILHIIGARYVYSNVPYEDWYRFISGSTLETGRNHFDRFVHFSFGILFFPYLYQTVQKWGLKSISKNIIITWLMIQSMSLIYELFEWGLTLTAPAESADVYNGQQGDMWDAQKDMALAMLGSTVMSIYYFFKNLKTNNYE